jgi:3-deoxy-D-manno-octulosonic-acid transferase
MYVLYNLILTIGFIILSPFFLLKRDKYAAGFWQRLGYLPDLAEDNKPVVWLHCVSVGETNAAKPLVKAFQEKFPDYKLVVSTTTQTGQRLAREIFENNADLVFYFPFDWSWTARRVLRKIKPKLVLIMETELWFNFLREAKRAEAKVVLVNGRLSEKSFKNYSLIRSLMRKVLNNLDLALMSGEADAGRIIELGCVPEKVMVTGNIKFDLNFDENESDLTREFRHRFAVDSTRPLIVAASTHAPEEKWTIEAFAKIPPILQARLLLVPRHPERFKEVAEFIETSGFIWARRSFPQVEKDKRADIILLDSIGELRAVYSLAELVFVGGSLIPHGGQNILEPAAARKCVVTGFYTMNFAAIVQTFIEKQAVVQLPQLPENEIPTQLAEVLTDLLTDSDKRNQFAQNAFTVLLENRGATEKTINKIREK